MEAKYTTITVTRELSKRIRQYALSNDLKTSDVLTMAINRLYAEDLLTLYEEIDKDLGNKPRTYNIDLEAQTEADPIESRVKKVSEIFKNKK